MPAGAQASPVEQERNSKYFCNATRKPELTSLPWHRAEYLLETLSNRDIQENWGPLPKTPAGVFVPSLVRGTPSICSTQTRSKPEAGGVCCRPAAPRTWPSRADRRRFERRAVL